MEVGKIVRGRSTCLYTRIRFSANSPKSNAGEVEHTSDDFSEEEKMNRLVNCTLATLVWVLRVRYSGVCVWLLVHGLDNLPVLNGCRLEPGGRRGKGSVNKERLP